MYDKELVLNLLENMIDATNKILYRNRNINSWEDYLADDNSLMLLDSLCMQLIAIGEGVKKIDKITNKSLFKSYPQIPWREVAAMRDILSHHYFDLNAEIVFEVTATQIENLQKVLKDIKNDIS